jgi:hypothetical protein
MVHGPVERTGFHALRGHRVFGVPLAAVRGIEVEMAGRRFAAHRRDHGWEIDGRGANPGTTAALDDLVETVANLRAVDVFRPEGGTTSYGLAPPRGTITVMTARAARRLLLGDPNTSGSAFYARRAEDSRVIQVGMPLLTAIERVFYHRTASAPHAARAASRSMADARGERWRRGCFAPPRSGPLTQTTRSAWRPPEDSRAFRLARSASSAARLLRFPLRDAGIGKHPT